MINNTKDKTEKVEYKRKHKKYKIPELILYASENLIIQSGETCKELGYDKSNFFTDINKLVCEEIFKQGGKAGHYDWNLNIDKIYTISNIVCNTNDALLKEYIKTPFFKLGFVVYIPKLDILKYHRFKSYLALEGPGLHDILLLDRDGIFKKMGLIPEDSKNKDSKTKKPVFSDEETIKKILGKNYDEFPIMYRYFEEEIGYDSNEIDMRIIDFLFRTLKEGKLKAEAFYFYVKKDFDELKIVEIINYLILAEKDREKHEENNQRRVRRKRQPVLKGW